LQSQKILKKIKKLKKPSALFNIFVPIKNPGRDETVPRFFENKICSIPVYIRLNEATSILAR